MPTLHVIATVPVRGATFPVDVPNEYGATVPVVVLVAGVIEVIDTPMSRRALVGVKNGQVEMGKL